MRVLWFSSSSTGYVSERNKYNGGGWAASALEAIRHNNEIELGVSFNLSDEPFKVQKDGVTFYPIPAPSPSSLSYKLRKLWAIYGKGNQEKIEKESWQRYLPLYKRVVEDFKPDIIHVWGSEQRAGIVSLVTDVPIVLHIQGILNPYYNASLPPAVSLRMSKGSCNPIRTWMKCCEENATWNMSCYREKVIYQHVHHFMGRTLWDKAVSFALSPQAVYHHCDEFLRDVFYQESKRIIPSKLTIVSTISFPLFKGYDLILKTADILKNNYHLDFDWNCYGNIDPQFTEDRIGIYHDNCNVRLKGVVNADELKEALCSATLYFHPSYIDNSPNSVCEAQMLGLPTICANVGGLSTIVSHGVDGILIPANDPYQAAYQIYNLYSDIKQNLSMGEEGSKRAHQRHNKSRIVAELLDIYTRIIERK